MKITTTVTVPDGEFCMGCDFWYRDNESKLCYCILFDMIELAQRYRENMVSGVDILKCKQCGEGENVNE